MGAATELSNRLPCRRQQDGAARASTGWRPAALVVLLATLPAVSACRSGAEARAADGVAGMASCRSSASMPGMPPVEVRWVRPEDRSERRSLDRWCAGVGPVMVITTPDPVPAQVDALAILSWNVHVGGGDIDGLVQRLRAGAFSANRPVRHFVLLLQEAYRAGSLVPNDVRPLMALPDAIRPSTGQRERKDIAVVAARLKLHLYYAPSMRNGRPTSTDEDRGNAILSTLPLTDLAAIELPFERQRRVVVTARIQGSTSAGDRWDLVVASVHLDNLVGLRHAWIFSGPARQRQVRGLIAALPKDAPAVVAGDFNTWFGYRDPAYLTMASAFGATPEHDRRPTFAGLLRLDHAFFRLPAHWQATLARLSDRFGSDHHPLLGWVTFHRASG